MCFSVLVFPGINIPTLYHFSLPAFVVFFNGEDGIQADRVTGQDMFGISYGPQSEVYFLILFQVKNLAIFQSL